MREKASCTIEIKNVYLNSEADISAVVDALKALDVLGHKRATVRVSSERKKDTGRA